MLYLSLHPDRDKYTRIYSMDQSQTQKHSHFCTPTHNFLINQAEFSCRIFVILRLQVVKSTNHPPPIHILTTGSPKKYRQHVRFSNKKVFFLICILLKYQNYTTFRRIGKLGEGICVCMHLDVYISRNVCTYRSIVKRRR